MIPDRVKVPVPPLMMFMAASAGPELDVIEVVMLRFDAVSATNVIAPKRRLMSGPKAPVTFSVGEFDIAEKGNGGTLPFHVRGVVPLTIKVCVP